MAPRRNYTENDMIRMQQDAISRVREMQSRARQAAEEANQAVPPVPAPKNYQGWNTNPNVQRRGHQQKQELPPSPEEIKVPDPPVSPDPEPFPEPPPPQEPEPPKGKTTIIEDILSAVGLDDDRLLIIGLLFILINAKADTTVILALIYLLI